MVAWLRLKSITCVTNTKRKLKKKQLKATSLLKTKEYALIAVVAGQGLADIFRAQGVDYVIEAVKL